jgi:hypothetical protein
MIPFATVFSLGDRLPIRPYDDRANRNVTCIACTLGKRDRPLHPLAMP